MTPLDRAWPILERAAGIGDQLTRDEAERGLRAETMALFSRETSAALVSLVGPNTLRIGLAGGDLAELMEIEAEIEAWARGQGCESLEIVGRPGWERVLPGYRRAAVILRKDLS